MIYTPYSSRRMGGIIIQVFRSSQTDGSGRPVLTKGKRPLIQHVVLDNKKMTIFHTPVLLFKLKPMTVGLRCTAHALQHELSSHLRASDL